jgi:hypothetical protein
MIIVSSLEVTSLATNPMAKIKYSVEAIAPIIALIKATGIFDRINSVLFSGLKDGPNLSITSPLGAKEPSFVV